MGTRMVLHRYAPTVKDWEEQLYIVDEDFLLTYGSLNPTIPVSHFYEPNKGLLKVYLNGQLLLDGGGYSEVNDKEIKITLGNEVNGDYHLAVGDEIYIEIHKNKYCSSGLSTVSGTRFHTLEQEIYKARQFDDTSKPFTSIDARLDYIQKSLELIDSGVANVDIIYDYNDMGQIVRQDITGDYELVRTFDFNSVGDITEERAEYKGATVIKSHIYDESTGNLIRTTVRTSF